MTRSWKHCVLSGVIGLAVATVAILGASQGHDADAEGLGTLPLYEELRTQRVEPAGYIQDGQLRIDRFAFDLSDGDLYMLTLDDDRSAAAVFLGDGVVRAYPPDGIEHHQLERFLDDEDYLDEPFDRLVLWFADDTGDRLRALANNARGSHADDAADLLEDRRSELLDGQLANPDSRLLVALLEAGNSPNTVPYTYAQIDTDDHGWLTIEREPHNPEELRLFRYDERREVVDVWMEFNALLDFDADVSSAVIDGFSRSPDVEGKIEENDDDDDDWNARDLGLSVRPLAPHHENWSARVKIPRTDVDLAIDTSGDVKGRAALLIEPQQPLSALRLQLSRFVEVTDVRWRHTVPNDVDNVRAVQLLGGSSTAPDEPVGLTGDQLHYVKARHPRWMEDDLYEPQVTIALPRTVSAGERFVLELAYEGPLVENLRADSRYLLKDTVDWMPNHSDSRRGRMRLTFRMPDRFQVVSGMTLLEDNVSERTRVMQWVCDEPVRSMSFNFGQFNVSDIDVSDLSEIYLYEDDNRLGFSPGTNERVAKDLVGILRTFHDYFGPYPFNSLRLTEAPWNMGQAFPGLVLLSFRTFGQLHTREEAFFRAHEIAHQWWGAAVDWDSYRDQWISEGFAQYAAAMYTLNGIGDENEYLRMLDSWRLNVLGEVNVGQGLGLLRYGLRPERIRRSNGHEAGPVVVGYRLRTGKAPFDYYIVAYEKGAFILHMLRMMLTDLPSTDDTRFRTLMRTFVSSHRDVPATTDAFERIVSAAFDEPMDWFFDQWVYGIDVPTYRPNLQVSRVVDQRDPFLLHGMIRQEDVPNNFRMPVPILLRFKDRPPVVHRIWVDAPSVDVAIPLPAEPLDVEFNYQHAVLARVK